MLLNAQSVRKFTRNATKYGSVHQLVDKIVSPTEVFLGKRFIYTERSFEFEGCLQEDIKTNTYMRMGSEFEKCIINAWRGISNEGSSFASAGQVTAQVLKEMGISFLKNKCKIIHRTPDKLYHYVEGEVDILGSESKAQKLCIFEVKLTSKHQFIAVSWLLQIIVYAFAIKHATNRPLAPIYLIVGSFKDRTIRVVHLDWDFLLKFVSHLKMESVESGFFGAQGYLSESKTEYYFEITDKETSQTIYEFKLPEAANIKQYDFSFHPVLTPSSKQKSLKTVPSTIPRNIETIWRTTFIDSVHIYNQSTVTGMIIHQGIYSDVVVSLSKTITEDITPKAQTPPATPVRLAEESTPEASSSKNNVIVVGSLHYWKAHFDNIVLEYDKQKELGKDVAFEELVKANGENTAIAIQYTTDIVNAVKALASKPTWIKKDLKVKGLSDGTLANLKVNSNLVVYSKV